MFVNKSLEFVFNTRFSLEPAIRQITKNYQFMKQNFLWVKLGAPLTGPLIYGYEQINLNL